MMHLHCGGAVRRLPRAQFMYSRLHKMKLLAQEGDESARLRRINAVARGLSLHTRPIGTRDVRANAMRSVRGVRQVLTCARLGVTACRVCVCVCAYGRRIVEHAHSNGNYGYLLDLIDRFLDSKVDQQKFEDCTREMFGTAAYPLFTIDKLVHTLVRQVHAVVIDEPSERLIDMMYQHANPAAAAAAAAAAATAAAAVAVTAVAAPATATSAAASNTGAAPAEPAALEPPSYREQVNAIIPADDNCYRLDYVRARPRHGATRGDGGGRGRKIFGAGSHAPNTSKRSRLARSCRVCVRVGTHGWQITDERTLRVRLFARTTVGRPSTEAAMEETWSSYVDSYVRPEPTAPELQPQQPVFLKRCGRTARPPRDSGRGAIGLGADAACDRRREEGGTLQTRCGTGSCARGRHCTTRRRCPTCSSASST